MNKYNLIDSLSISFDINNEKDKKIIEFMSDDRLLPNLTSKFSTNKIYKNYDTYNYDNLNKYYNNTLQNVNLKRACCLRQDKNVDTYGDKEDFYVDFPGHFTIENINALLADLEKSATFYKWLGSYPIRVLN
jgi:hypothetical protein